MRRNVNREGDVLARVEERARAMLESDGEEQVRDVVVTLQAALEENNADEHEGCHQWRRQAYNEV